MLLSCGIWSAYGSLIAPMCLFYSVPVCMGGEGFYIYTCISPLLSPFLFYFYVRLFFLDSMCLLYLCVCLYGCGVVWCCVVGFLSLSLWIVAGMAVGWRHCRGGGEALWPYCNYRDTEELEEAITGKERSYLPQHPNLSLHSQPSCVIDCSKQCIMVFPCLFINI